MTEQFYKRIELEDGVEVQYVGTYVLRWPGGLRGGPNKPEVGFIELDEQEQRLADTAPQLLEALETLLTHPSDDPSDAVVAEDDYLLTPLQIAERKARIIIAAAKGEK